MRAHARLSVTAEGDRSRIGRLRSEAPLVLRPTIAARPSTARPRVPGGAVHVALAAATAGPIGGDRFRLDVEVGPGAALVLQGVSATLALPGPHGEPSYSDVHVHVAERGTLLWLPRPVIAARNCDHRAATRIDLGPGARLLAREELILGRHGERPGAVRQRLRVTLAGQPLYDQELAFGPGAPGWAGPAVTGGHRAVGSALLVDPDAPPGGSPRPPAADAATLSLGDDAVVISALADDAVTLRRNLDACLGHASLLEGTR
ncbi:urease accessory protein UreD [Spirillospora sp. NPDC048819]|uniref:urease accessory protein UreD n=1 Tax=Spirillospora sp. NPDC048819 TaxID=3155268 RepID=UPI0033F56AB7